MVKGQVSFPPPRVETFEEKNKNRAEWGKRKKGRKDEKGKSCKKGGKYPYFVSLFNLGL